MTGIELIIYSLILVLAIFYLLTKRKTNGLPPGPFPYPIIGNLVQVGDAPHLALTKMSKVYGPIMTVYLGTIRSVILSDPIIVRKNFNDMVFSGRPQFELLLERCGGKVRGIAFAENRRWVEQRRFLLKNLKNFGFTKKSMELNTLTDLEELVQQLRSKIGQPIDLAPYFSKANINSLWSIMCGEYLERELIQEMFDIIERDLANLTATGLAFIFPKIAKLAPKVTGYDALTKSSQYLMKIVKAKIKILKKNHIPGEKQHFVDAFLEEIKNTTDPTSSFYGDEGEIQLAYVIADLFIAGVETTGTALNWAFCIMAYHKDIQLKIQKEIDSAIGQNRSPELEDRPILPYLECFVMEVLRYASVAPLGVFHRTTENVILEGYKIPKDTIVYSNIYGIHHDPKLWGDPEVIRPERFLMDDGISVNRNHECWIPFQTGKRLCVGDKLVMNNMFLIIATLCQEFEFHLENPSIAPHLYPKPGIIVRPQEHHMILRKRETFYCQG